MKYCLENNIPFKILFIVDNGPFIGDLHPNVSVLVLPPDTTSVIQTIDPGIIAALMAHYLRKIFAQAIAVTQLRKTQTIGEGLQYL